MGAVSQRRWPAGTVAGVVVCVALLLIIQRGGLIAWAAMLAGIALLAAVWWRPSERDLKRALTVAAVAAGAWIVTLVGVIASYESGEVIELGVDTADGERTVRLWVLDVDAVPTLYFDADRLLAAALVGGRPVRLLRAGTLSTAVPVAVPVDELPADQAERLLDAMGAKYGARLMAANAYYLLLGRPRERVGLVIRLRDA